MTSSPTDAGAKLESVPLDDRVLLALSAEPQAPLWPLLRRADQMAPLVVVLAFLAALFSVGDRTLTDRGARHAELSLRLLSSAGVEEWLERDDHPGVQPDLALSFRLFGPATGAALAIAPAVCTAGLIFAVYLLGKNLSEGLLGLIAAFFVACNPRILVLAQEPAPESAALLFGVLGLAATIAHWRSGANLVSWPLLGAGLSFGLCLLSGGLLAFELFSVLFLYAVARSIAVKLRRASRPGVPARPRRRVSVSSLAVLAVIGFSVGGWRTLLLLAFQKDVSFSDSFRAAMTAAISNFDPSEIPALAARANETVTPFLGLSVLGLTFLLVDGCSSRDDSQRSYGGLILSWLAVCVGAALAGVHSTTALSVGDWFELTAPIPLALAAAYGVREILSRRASFAAACAAAALSLGNAVWLQAIVEPAHMRHGVVVQQGADPGWLLRSLLCGTIAATAVSVVTTREADRRRRRILSGTLATIGLVCATWALTGVARANGADRELDELRNRLDSIAPPDRLVFLSFDDTPKRLTQAAPQLEYLFRSAWSDCEVLAETSTWEEAVARIRELPPEEDDAPPRRLIVTWGPRNRGLPQPDSTLVRIVGPPAGYRNLEISLYAFGGDTF
jgi:hypothetical protein